MHNKTYTSKALVDEIMYGFGFSSYPNANLWTHYKKTYVHPDLDLKIEVTFWGEAGKIKDIYMGNDIRYPGSRWTLPKPGCITDFIKTLLSEIDKAPTREESKTTMASENKVE